MRIQVWRKPEFSGDFVIAPDGSISHPLYRSVRVAGVPFATAEANIRRFLSGFEENPQFVMEPLVRVAVSGEVTRPMVFATRPETTIGEALARAGGCHSESEPATGFASSGSPRRDSSRCFGWTSRTPTARISPFRCAPVT